MDDERDALPFFNCEQHSKNIAVDGERDDLPFFQLRAEGSGDRVDMQRRLGRTPMCLSSDMETTRCTARTRVAAASKVRA